MSDSDEEPRKRFKSGQERNADYRKNNPQMCKLSKEKSKLTVMKKKSEDEFYAQTLKKKERERKAEQRRKKALLSQERREENILEEEINVETEEGKTDSNITSISPLRVYLNLLFLNISVCRKRN